MPTDMNMDLQSTLLELEELQYSEAMTPGMRLLVSAMKVTLSAIGQCEIEEPFSPLQPILTSDGLKWCCDHDPRHCSEVIG